jgi:hypothetical protein
MGLEGALAHRATWIAAAMTAVAPLACLRSLDALRHTSIIALLAAVRAHTRPTPITVIMRYPPPPLLRTRQVDSVERRCLLDARRVRLTI